MVDQLPSYLFTKRNIYYYSRRLPPKMRAIYGKKRLVVSLGTKSFNEGLSLSHALTGKLDLLWKGDKPSPLWNYKMSRVKSGQNSVSEKLKAFGSVLIFIFILFLTINNYTFNQSFKDWQREF